MGLSSLTFRGGRMGSIRHGVCQYKECDRVYTQEGGGTRRKYCCDKHRRLENERLRIKNGKSTYTRGRLNAFVDWIKRREDNF